MISEESYRQEKKGWKNMEEKRYFVVIVEPDEVNAERIHAILDSVDKDFEYELTSLPEHGIEIVESRRVDVFISSLELNVMTGAELFSVIKILSPETVRVAMTDANRIAETVECMNQCKTFKVIIKPCRIADDLIAPINASIAYKEMRERLHQEEAAFCRGLSATEQDIKELEIEWQVTYFNYERIKAVLLKMANTNVESGNLGPEMEVQLKDWYDWLLDTYMKTMIDSDGDFEHIEKCLYEKYHEHGSNRTFQLRKKFDAPVIPQKMNEIHYMIQVVIEAVKICCGEYRIAAVIEETEKAYILRIIYAPPKETEIYAQENGNVRKALAKAAEEAIAAFGYQSVTMDRESEILMNIAVPK